MRRPLYKFFLIVIVILLLTLAACDSSDGGTDKDNKPYVVSISVDADTVPQYAIAGQVNLRQIKLLVKMSNDEIQEIPITDEMVYSTDRAKLNMVGAQEIRIIYGGRITKFWLSIEPASEITYTLKVIGGAMEGREPINNEWEGVFVAGTKVTIRAIDRSSEGYNFVSWTVGGQVINRNPTCEITVNNNITIVANYQQQTFKVTFKTQGGSNVAARETKIIEESPVTVRPEYVFVEWRLEDTGEKVVFPYNVTKDITLVAVWESLGLVYEMEPGNTGYTIIGYEYQGSRTTLEIPEKHGERLVVKIGKDAFKNAHTLKTIKISRYINTIEDYAFSECINLLNFEIDENNSFFDVINGVLYRGDTLVAYPAGRMAPSFDVLSVAQIGAGAFYNANVGTVNLKSSLVKIGDNAFNSRTIDNVVFSYLPPAQIGQHIFNENIDRIYIEQSGYLENYLNHPAFQPYADKIAELVQPANIGIYDNFLYKVITREIEGISQATIEIIGADRSISSITIPIIAIEGKRVTSIGAYAFSYCYNLSNVEISQQSPLDRIMKGAFENTLWQTNPSHNYIRDGLIIIHGKLFSCLEDRAEYTIPYDVISIAEYCFADMNKLKKVTFATDNHGNTHITEIKANAFKNCVNLDEITIPFTVESLGVSAFEKTKLSRFEFESNSRLNRIEDYCFANASRLSKISLGAYVEYVGRGVFNGCYSLSEILISGQKDAANDYFVVKDGVLFEKDKTLQGIIDNFGRWLHTYPAGRIDDVYEVPYDEGSGVGVTRICEYAFHYSNVSAVVLPLTLERILSNAFISPQLVYLEFTSNMQMVSSYFNLFPVFGPDYIIIADNDTTNYSTWGAPAGVIKKKSEFEALNIKLGLEQTADNQSFLYRLDQRGLYIIGAERGSAELVIPSSITIGEDDYSVSGIDKYAFMGNILHKVTLPDTLEIIKAYAFYYCDGLQEIVSHKAVPPALEYQDEGDEESLLSFSPDILINKAIIYTPSGSEQIYADNWPMDIDYIIAIGTQPQITFEPNNGSEPILINPETGEPYDLSQLDVIPASPVTERLGYDFAGWYDNPDFEGQPITFPYVKYRNITLYAKWNVRFYNIVYYLVGGEFEVSDPISSVAYDSIYNLPVPIKTGYNFTGWYDKNGIRYTDERGIGLGVGSPVHQANSTWGVVHDVELFAAWQEKEYIITYEPNGGVVSQPELRVLYNSEFVVENPVREGYTFAGWIDENGNPIAYLDGNSIGKYEYTEDIVIYAQWTPNTYTVSFNDGQGTVYPTQTVVFDQNFVFPVPVKEDSVFFGWYSEAGGTGVQYTDENGHSVRVWDIPYDTTLYAQWPIDISSYEDFEIIRTNPEGSYILTADITLESDWTPIGPNADSPFTGILDGNGHTIYYTSIVSDFAGYVGFIGYNNGIIRNLNLGIKYIENGEIEIDRSGKAEIDIIGQDDSYNILYVGGLAGYNGADGVIVNCNIAAKISVVMMKDERDMMIGGVTGYNKGKIVNTYIVTEIDVEIDESVINPGNEYIGTIAGYHSSEALIDGCSYDRIVDSEQEQSQPFGNNEDIGEYRNTVGKKTQEEW